MKLLPHASHFMLTIFCAFLTPLLAQTQIPWCFDATPDDFQAAIDFENSHQQVASSLNTEISIPLYIIYVNSDDGTPPGKDYKLREQVNQANAAYDSFLRFRH